MVVRWNWNWNWINRSLDFSTLKQTEINNSELGKESAIQRAGNGRIDNRRSVRGTREKTGWTPKPKDKVQVVCYS